MSIKILIVDDSTPILEMLKFALKGHKPEIITALDGDEALEVAKKEKFDLIISDVEMPRMNGVDFGIELRKLKFRTPIIFYSAYDSFPLDIQSKLSKIEGATLITNKHVEMILKTVGDFVKARGVVSNPA